MAIDYVRVKRKILVGKVPGYKYLARIYRGQDITMDQIAKEISASTTIAYPDVLAALKALEMTISDHVLNGSAVKFNYLGYFIPGIKAMAKDTLEEVDSHSIKRAKCRFVPSIAFKDDLRKTYYRQVDLDVTGYQHRQAAFNSPTEGWQPAFNSPTEGWQPAFNSPTEE